jgi:hypothetical protein
MICGSVALYENTCFFRQSKLTAAILLKYCLMWALTKLFQIMDIFTNLQEVFSISYFEVVVDSFSSIVTFLQFIRKNNHIKLYCAQLDMSKIQLP